MTAVAESLMRRAKIVGAVVSLAGLCAVSCASPEQQVVLVFPSEELKNATSAVEVRVYRISDGTDPCEALSRGEEVGAATELMAQSEAFPFEPGSISVGELKNGRYAFFGAARNKTAQKKRFLAGCTATDIRSTGQNSQNKSY